MKVICFIGEPKSGKSTTIKKILEDSFFRINIKKPKIVKDFCLSFIYGNKPIGICSLGDTPAILKKYLIPLKHGGSEIIICACHPKKKPREFLKNMIGGEIKEIRCNFPEIRDEEHWAIEHSKRIDEFRRIFP